MKKITLNVVILMLTLNSFGQQIAKDKVNEQSKAEIFSERVGSLVQKEFIDIGRLKKCNIQVAKFSDLINGTKFTAIRFELEYQSSYSSDTKIAMLDEDEIDGLMKSIKLIQEKILPIKATNYTEVNFKSRSGFIAGCYSKKDSWTAFMKLEKYDSNSYVWFDKDDLGTLLTLLEQAKAKF